MKKIATALIALILSFGILSTASAEIASLGDPGRVWSIPDDAQKGQHIIQFLDVFPNEISSALVSTSFKKGQKEDPTCLSGADKKCSSGFFYRSVLPQCGEVSQVNCIEDFGVTKSGVKTSAKFEKYYASKLINPFTGDETIGLPTGVSGSLYSLPQAPFEGGDTYYLNVLSSGFGSASSIQSSDFQVVLYPAKVIPGIPPSPNNKTQSGFYDLTGDGGGDVGWGEAGPGFTGNTFCVATSRDDGTCMQRYNFPADTRFYVKVRVQKLPTGWMHGRISNPEINIIQSNGFNTLEFEADPIAVPTVYKMHQWLSMPPELKANYDERTGMYKPDALSVVSGGSGGRTAWDPDPLKRNTIIAPRGWEASGMEQLKLILPYVNDQATAMLSYWSVRTLSEQEMLGANQCFKGSTNVTGVVNTNSTQYSAGPPLFNKSEGTLEYKVASPHYTDKKEVFKGTYDLVIRSEVARCLYGFSKAPINAVISVTSADGKPQIATTVMGEKNGWVYLSAKNFEFSSPTVKVRFEQAPEPAPSQTATATPAPTAPSITNVKKSIICVKGKSKKKVTGVTPKCPSGYKRAA